MSDAVDQEKLAEEWESAEAEAKERKAEGEDEDIADAWDQLTGEGGGHTNRILNQEEIDNLLGFDASEEEETDRSGIKAIINSALVNYERLPMLEVVFDRLVRMMTTSLRNFTSDNVEVTLDNITSIRFGDYLNSIPLPAILSVFRAVEWDNFGLITVDSSLIYSIVDVLLGGHQRVVLVLAADVDEASGDGLERADADDAAVDESAAAPVGVDQAPDHQLFADLDAFGLEQRVDLLTADLTLKLEGGLDDGALGVRPHHVGAGPAAKDQVQRVDDDRLARAGLPGQDPEAVAELQLQAVDDGKVTDDEVRQHSPTHSQDICSLVHHSDQRFQFSRVSLRKESLVTGRSSISMRVAMTLMAQRR